MDKPANVNTSGYLEKKNKLIICLNKDPTQSQTPLSLQKNRSNLFRPNTSNNREKRIDLRNFNQVIEVDRDKMLAHVEGLTTYEDLVQETLKYSCLPTVVPELKSITIGGALAGCGIESSSFRYGLVHETIQEIDVLLSDGRVVSCTPKNEYKDLFYSFPNSYGTLGYALKVVVQLIPAKKFVKLTHTRFSDSTLYFQALNQLCTEYKSSGPISFIDGVIFDKDEMFITTGEFVETAPFVSNYKYKNIYYRSIQNTEVDYLTTSDYIWRWDPDWFWCSKVFFLQNPLVRLLLGKFMLTSKVYTKIMNYIHRHPAVSNALSAFSKKSESIIQDVLIPIQHGEKFLHFFQQEIGIKPIWVCPSKSYIDSKYEFCPMDPNSLYLDFGFWDSIPTNNSVGFYNKKIEGIVKELGGFKSLYSSSYYSEDEFWSLYNHPLYISLKNKYDPHNLLGDLYKKCRGSSQ